MEPTCEQIQRNLILKKEFIVLKGADEKEFLRQTCEQMKWKDNKSLLLQVNAYFNMLITWKYLLNLLEKYPRKVENVLMTVFMLKNALKVSDKVILSHVCNRQMFPGEQI